MLNGAKTAIAANVRSSLRRPLLSSPRTALLASFARPVGAPNAAFAAARAAGRFTPCSSAFRHHSTTSSSQRILDEPAKEVDYKEVKKIAEHPDPNVVLVDVREPSEYEAGHIPHAVNIPFKSMPGALGLDSAEFEATLGFPKPSPSKTLLFYCLGGVRSTGSEQIASTYGYRNRMNYKGSYSDWTKQEEAAKGAKAE